MISPMLPNRAQKASMSSISTVIGQRYHGVPILELQRSPGCDYECQNEMNILAEELQDGILIIN